MDCRNSASLVEQWLSNLGDDGANDTTLSQQLQQQQQQQQQHCWTTTNSFYSLNPPGCVSSQLTGNDYFAPGRDAT